MNWKFWLLQGLGWMPYAAVQVLLSSEDLPLDAPEHLGPALLLVAYAVVGSLALRAAYRRLAPRLRGELRWLAAIVGCSVLLALAIDASHAVSLRAVAAAMPSLSSAAAAQPPLAHAPLLALTYVAWSLLYVALGRQRRLERAGVEQQRLRAALEEAEMQRLLGQLSPHFVFNTLNNIRAVILQDAEAARTLLTRFAATLRYQFDGQHQAQVTLQEELAIVHDYLALFRLQLGSRLHYRERIAPDALAVAVPRFALQLLVENAIKHGLAPSSQPGTLDVDIELHDACLQIEVRNSGRLGDRRSGGIGLVNLEQRLQLLHPGAAQFRLEQDGDRVLAHLRIDRVRTEPAPTRQGAACAR